MNVICVDDEQIILDDLVEKCIGCAAVASCVGFSDPEEAQDYLSSHDVDVMVSDISMPVMNGLELAGEVRAKRPDVGLVFTTAYSEYAVDAFALRADGYLVKPVDPADLQRELLHAYQRCVERRQSKAHVPDKRISVHTFGNFSVRVSGARVSFRRSKCAEILAYLVDARGRLVARRELSDVLWPGEPYGESKQAYLSTLLHSLKKDLGDAGASDLLESDYARLAVNCDAFDCDLYRLLDGDVQLATDYKGNYLSEYAWAEGRMADIEAALANAVGIG